MKDSLISETIAPSLKASHLYYINDDLTNRVVTNMRKQYESIVYECYRRLYAFAIPSANFDELIKYATFINDKSFSEEYSIDYSVADAIIKDCIEEFELTDAEMRKRFRSDILLGACPKYFNPKR